jgi:hypothetical protein
MFSAVLGDGIIAAVMVVFCIVLLPVLLSPLTRYPWWASTITATGLFVMSVVFLLLGLDVSAVTSVVQSSLWAFIAVFRHTEVTP